MTGKTGFKASESIVASSSAASAKPSLTKCVAVFRLRSHKGDRAALWKVGVISVALFASVVAAIFTIILELEGFPLSVWLTMMFATVVCALVAIFLIVGDMVTNRKRGFVLIVLICLSLRLPLVALSQEIDEGEFSRTMLSYKLQLLKNQFEQTELSLLTRSVSASIGKQLEHLRNEIKCLEAEFRRGRYYPDLLDEQIVIIREELRLMGDPHMVAFGTLRRVASSFAVMVQRTLTVPYEYQNKLSSQRAGR
jgi:hypothetical protein